MKGGNKKYTIAGTVSYKFEPMVKKPKGKAEEEEPLVAWSPLEYTFDDSPLITTFDNTVFLSHEVGSARSTQSRGKQLISEVDYSHEDEKGKESTPDDAISVAHEPASDGLAVMQPDYKGMPPDVCV